MNKELNYKELKEKALKQFKNGEPLFGKNGAFAPMLKSFIEEALKAEMEAHLDEETRNNGNKRNVEKQKLLKAQKVLLLSIPHKIEKVNLNLKLFPNIKPFYRIA